jgi:hypothetical protein
LSRFNQTFHSRNLKLPNDNPSSSWRPGELLVVIRDHVVYKADVERERTDCVLRTPNGKMVKPKEIIAGTIVMALETQPIVGQRALVRVLHDGSIWVVNSNYVELYNNNIKKTV